MRGHTSINQCTKSVPKPVLGLGGGGKVAGLLRAAFVAMGDERIAWQSRNATAGADGFCFNPMGPDGHRRLVGAMVGAPIVFALAGATPQGDFPLRSNSDQAGRVLAAAREAGAKHVFFVSSAAVYGHSAVAHTETETLHPSGEYSVNKCRMEARVLREKGALSTTILRIGNVAGADQLLGGIKRQRAIGLDRFGTGKTPLRSYIGPMTLARVLARLFDLAEAGEGLPDVLNVAAPEPVYMRQLLEATGRDFTYRQPDPEAVPVATLDVSRLAGIYGFSPKESQPGEIVAELSTVLKIQSAPRGTTHQ